ncbi:hypothetical protein CSA08_05080 [Candidatus Gracilibacteria bacterium]|nr:MAG: hypothetical protein CSA08_05080 [Candidatus Gracilibacteria bacterium]
MKKLVLVLLTMLSINLFAQDWKDQLATDLVVVKDGKMTITDLTLITILEDGSSVQIKTYAEAPINSFISRDQFVAIFSTNSYVFIKELLAEGGFTEEDYKIKTVDIKDLIGTADVELVFYMGRNGMQVVVEAAGEQTKITQTWESIFE